MKAKLILVGGFLGAGKTTLLWKMAEIATKKGIQTGLITNDQAPELVDTSFLAKSGQITFEVSGSCFCCNFSGFLDAIETLCHYYKIGIIVAEPVGSCTDLSATIIQPMKEQYQDMLQIMPFSVLVDPVRLQSILAGGNAGMDEHAAYIMRKQLEEADIIVINKKDLLDEQELGRLKTETQRRFPLAEVLGVSALTGEGVEEWLTVLEHKKEVGTHIAEVDYDIYAKGEAVLGWLNVNMILKAEQTDWKQFVEKYLTAMGKQFEKEKASVGHIKVMIEEENGFVMGNLMGGLETLRIRGTSSGKAQVKLILNARVEIAPKQLQDIALAQLEEVCGTNIQYDIKVVKCIQPGRPIPTFRYANIVEQ